MCELEAPSTFPSCMKEDRRPCIHRCSITATARELGISREWASRQANAPETEQIIVSLLPGELERVHQMFDKRSRLFSRRCPTATRSLWWRSCGTFNQ
jgi:hypothetical protein